MSPSDGLLSPKRSGEMKYYVDPNEKRLMGERFQ